MDSMSQRIWVAVNRSPAANRLPSGVATSKSGCQEMLLEKPPSTPAVASAIFVCDPLVRFSSVTSSWPEYVVGGEVVAEGIVVGAAMAIATPEGDLGLRSSHMDNCAVKSSPTSNGCFPGPKIVHPVLPPMPVTASPPLVNIVTLAPGRWRMEMILCAFIYQ